MKGSLCNSNVSEGNSGNEGAEKLLESGKWHDGKMPRTAFPLSKSHSYSLGNNWCWSVWRLGASERQFRLLVAFELAKGQYQAWLGLEARSDQAILARLEYHPSHRGWHCHLKIGRLTDVSWGVVKQPNTREVVKLCRNGDSFAVTELNALSVAFKVFNVEVGAGDGGLFQ